MSHKEFAMTRTKPIMGECQHCGRALEFPAEHIGLMAPCPHCGQQTELMLATPPEEPLVPRRVIVWTAITVGLLIAGLVFVLVQLKRLERQAAEKRQRSADPAQVATNSPIPTAPKPGGAQ